MSLKNKFLKRKSLYSRREKLTLQKSVRKYYWKEVILNFGNKQTKKLQGFELQTKAIHTSDVQNSNFPANCVMYVHKHKLS